MQFDPALPLGTPAPGIPLVAIINNKRAVRVGIRAPTMPAAAPAPQSGGMDTRAGGHAVVQGWNGPRSADATGEALPAELCDHAVALATIVAAVPAATPINVEALRAQVGPRWEGVERIIDILEASNLALTAGEADQETVSFTVIPAPAYV